MQAKHLVWFPPTQQVPNMGKGGAAHEASAENQDSAEKSNFMHFFSKHFTEHLLSGSGSGETEMKRYCPSPSFQCI